MKNSTEKRSFVGSDSWSYLLNDATSEQLDWYADNYDSETLLEYALCNKNMSGDTLRKVYEKYKNEWYENIIERIAHNHNTPNDVLMDIHSQLMSGRHDYDARIHSYVCGNPNVTQEFLHKEAIRFINGEVKKDNPWSTNLDKIIFNKRVSTETLKMIVLKHYNNMSKLHALFRYFMINENECKEFTHKNICSKKTLSESNDLLEQKFEKWKKEFDFIIDEI